MEKYGLTECKCGCKFFTAPKFPVLNKYLEYYATVCAKTLLLELIVGDVSVEEFCPKCPDKPYDFDVNICINSADFLKEILKLRSENWEAGKICCKACIYYKKYEKEYT